MKGARAGLPPQRSRGPQRPVPRPPHPPRAPPSPVQAGSAPAPRPLTRSQFARRVEEESRRHGPAGHPSLFHAYNFPLTCRSPRKNRMPLPSEVRPQVRMPPLLPEKRRRGIQGVREGGGTAGSRGGRWHHRRGRAWGARSPPRFPVYPRGVLISGLGVAAGRALLQVAAARLSARGRPRQT